MAALALILSKEMSDSLKYFLGDLRWPEAIAAIALVIQTFILWQHRKILTGFGETLERQAETAKLIGHSLEQHGRILADHTRIMDEQFKFQKKLEAKIETSKIENSKIENSKIENSKIENSKIENSRTSAASLIR